MARYAPIMRYYVTIYAIAAAYLFVLPRWLFLIFSLDLLFLCSLSFYLFLLSSENDIAEEPKKIKR